MIAPTNLGIRNDKAGFGFFGASRGTRTHLGVDFLCQPGEYTICPISGDVIRVAIPYQNAVGLSGVLVQNELFQVKLFYTMPIEKLIGTTIREGDRIGINQDVRFGYPNETKMQAHIHFQLKMLWQGEWIIADPLMFLN